MFFESIEDGTAGFVSMSAVAETAFFGEAEYFGEIVSYFFRLEFDCTEATDSWSVDYFATAGQVEHFRKSSGMHASVVCG